MYAILFLCLLGFIIGGAHFLAALIEHVAMRKQARAQQITQAIDDAQLYAETASVIVVDQKHSPPQPHAFDVQELFRGGQR